ncbi:MAG: penicillin-binding protein 1C [Pseudomonadota bacterium]
MRRLKAFGLKRSAALFAAGAALLLLLNWAFPPPLDKAQTLSVMVTDRQGKPLRAFPTVEGRWRFAANLDEIDPLFVEALLAVEDKRFYRHLGVDALAIMRAATTSALAGEIVSGGSTITMQTARLLEPRERTLRSKLVEVIRALQIEARLSKREILELYLTLAPYGGNLEGVRAASHAWFGHGPEHLTDDEIALLIALPQSPEVRRPDRRPEAARQARLSIATKLVQMGALDDVRKTEIAGSPLPTRHAFPNRAWHASEEARATGPQDSTSTLDAGLQQDLERLLARHAAELGREVQLSAIVVDVPTRAVRAAIGSASRNRPGGWIDLTDQPRSPGSTLKPFIYAMTFDDGIALPDTRITDLPRRFAAYQPENFDRSFNGDVTIAEALQHSLNVPAVIALDRVGPDRFAAQLTSAGVAPRTSGADKGAGLAIALGGIGITLRELAVLYAALGDGGVSKPLIWKADLEEVSKASTGQRLMSASSAAEIIEILKRAPAPKGYLPGRLTQDAPQIAFKTGTSYGFRDAWAAGVSANHAIVVWVGRADGAPRPGHVGRTDALPILFEIADRADIRLRGDASNAGRVSEDRRDRPRAVLAQFTEVQPPEILFPPRGAELWMGSDGDRPPRGFVFAGRGDGQLRWYIDGSPADLDDAGRAIWFPRQAGFYRVSAVDSQGRISATNVRILASAAAQKAHVETTSREE